MMRRSEWVVVMTRSVLLLLMLPALASGALGLEPMRPVPSPRIYLEEFHMATGGQFSVVTWRDYDPHLTDIRVDAGCRALGLSCAVDSDQPANATRYLKRTIAIENYLGTARISRQRGDRTYAKFTAPDGFTVCRAGIYLRDGAITPGATFAGAILRSGQDGLGVYADLGPLGAGKRSIEFKLLVQYVARQSPEATNCWPDGTIVFLCGPKGCEGSRSFPESVLR